MKRYESHTPTDPPEIVMAERLEAIAADLEQIADALEEGER
ncbi:hypothetical protein [Natrarchaeobaculum sulfurireducens]|nr:hypothetical protein [Natrarchaeobaculum sulfurireducens]